MTNNYEQYRKNFVAIVLSDRRPTFTAFTYKYTDESVLSAKMAYTYICEVQWKHRMNNDLTPPDVGNDFDDWFVKGVEAFRFAIEDGRTRQIDDSDDSDIEEDEDDDG